MTTPTDDGVCPVCNGMGHTGETMPTPWPPDYFDLLPCERCGGNGTKHNTYNDQLDERLETLCGRQ